jgi:hypothetical protein
MNHDDQPQIKALQRIIDFAAAEREQLPLQPSSGSDDLMGTVSRLYEATTLIADQGQIVCFNGSIGRGVAEGARWSVVCASPMTSQADARKIAARIAKLTTVEQVDLDTPIAELWERHVQLEGRVIFQASPALSRVVWAAFDESADLLKAV